MAVVTRSIGTGGRDYSTISLWEADLDNTGIYSSGDDAIGECYADSDFDESVTINGGNTVGLNSRTLSVAAGERHDGTAGTGARIVASSSGTMRATRDRSILEWVEIDANGHEYAIEFQNNFQDEYRIKNVLFHGWTGNTANVDMVGGSNSRDIVVQNCIVYDCDLSGTGGAITGIRSDFNGAAHAPAGILNNTVHAISQSSGGGDAFGIETNGNATDQHGVVNNLCTSITATGTATCFDTFAGSPFSANMSDDSTGNTGLTNIVVADQYVSTVVGSEDLHLKSGADAIDAGIDLGTSPADVNIDIKGRDRDAEGDTWDIGAHEFEAAGGGTTTPQDVGGMITPTGDLNGLSIAILGLAGSVAISGAISRGIAVTVAGSSAVAGAVRRLTSVEVLGSFSPYAALATAEVLLQSVAGQFAPSGALFKQVRNIIGGSIAVSGSILRLIKKQLSGVSTLFNALRKFTSVTRTGTTTPSGVGAPQSVLTRAVGGEIAPSGVVVKQLRTVLIGSITLLGGAAKRIQKAVAGSVALTGGIARRIGKRVVGTVATIGAALVTYTQNVLGQLPIHGDVSRNKNPAVVAVNSVLGFFRRRTRRR